MPYCTSCGSEVASTAAFCSHCGRAQAKPTGPRRQPSTAAFENVTPRTASILCYIPIFGVIPAIIVLASQRFRTNSVVRFDAFQSVYLFVAWLIASTALPIILIGLPGWGLERGVLGLVKLGFLVCWIVLLVKAAQNQRLHLPLLGDLAWRSTTEQL